MESQSVQVQELLSQIEQLKEECARLQGGDPQLGRVRSELVETEQKYRMAFEHTGTAMIVIEQDLTISMGNHRMEAITGYSNEELLRKRPWTDYVCEQDHEKMLQFHQLRPEQGEWPAAQYEFRLRHRSGELRDVSCNISSIPGTTQTLVSFIDVTEQKHTERQLQASQQRFKETAELLPSVICEIDMSLKVNYVNQKGFRLFGFTVEQLASGIHVLDLFGPAERERAKANAARILSGELIGPQEYQMLHADGSSHWYLLSSAPVVNSDKTVVGLRTSLLEVDQLKQTQLRLEQSEALFRNIFSQSPLGVALFNPDGSCLESNGAFNTLFDEVGGRNLFDLTAMPTRGRQQLAAGEGYVCEGCAGGLQQGLDRFFDWHVTPLRSPQTLEPVYLAQVHDITARKKAHEATVLAARQETEKAKQLIEELRKEMRETFTFRDMVSRSPDMRRIFDILPELAQTPATVLVCGESGTGKELIARSVHELSARSDKPFVAINCGALPDNLLESELFGYKAGAFTDAKKDKPGKFAQAEGGTLFLDEIGDISVAMQVKLLRVLQERVYEPLGASASVRADVRVVAATNRDLAAMVKAGQFREDLYYRINVLQVRLPPLCQRRCDIPLLCEHLVEQFNRRYAKSIQGLSPEALGILLAHDFPGNIRELENIIEHAFVFCKESVIQTGHLPAELGRSAPNGPAGALPQVGNFDELERLYIRNVIAECGGNKLRAAEKLGIHKATLFRKLKKLGLGQ